MRASKPRALIYLRVSDEGGRGVDLLSVEIQRTACVTFCNTNGFAIVDTVTDVDRTGRRWSDRGIVDAAARIAAGEIDMVVVWKWTRFSRNRLDWAIEVDRIESIGGRLLSSTEPYEPTAVGKLTRGILAEFGAFESDRIGEGWAETHQNRLNRGLPPGGRVVWGWVNTRQGVTAHPDRAPIVAELYRRYLDGQGFQQLAKWLNESGQPTTRSGNRWHPNAVRYILDSPTHAGLVRWKGEVRPGAHAGIIDEETWRQYQATRRDNRRVGRKTGSQYLLAGLLICGHCGHTMHGATREKWSRYICGHAAATRRHSPLSVSVGKLEPRVTEWLATLADELNAAIDAQPAAPMVRPDSHLIEAQIGRLDGELVKLTGHLVSGLVPEAAYAATRDDIISRRDELADALTRQRNAEALAAPLPYHAAADLLDVWDELAVVARRSALRELIDCVVVWPGRVLRTLIIPA